MSDFNIDYTGKDYLALVDRADAFLKELLPEWTNRDDNDVNWATVKTVAYLISIGMFYIDLSVNEQDPFEVQIYSNALNLAKRFGMPVKRAVGAITTLSVTVKAHDTTKVLIRGTEFPTTSGLSYVLLEDVSFPPGTNTLPCVVQFGVWQQVILGKSDGTIFQKFTIDVDDVQSGAVRLFITEGATKEEWNVKHTLLMSYENSEDARLVLNEEEQYELHFGDGENGKVPVAESEIMVELLTLAPGYELNNYGNLPLGNITTCKDTDVTTVVQSYDASGGFRKETAAEIGRALSQWFSVGERCISVPDFVYHAKRVAGIADAQANQDNMTMVVYVVTADGSVASPALRNKVEAYLMDRKLPQIALTILVPTTVLVDVVVDITVDNDKSRPVIKALVEDLLRTYLTSSSVVGRSIQIKALYDKARNVVGLNSFIVRYLHKSSESASLNDVVMDVDEISAAGTVTVNATGGLNV